MFSIGPSSYGDLRGVEQFIATERMANQFWSVKVDFDAWMAKLGRTGRLSANEGYRNKERCYYLWDHRHELGVVVAPPLTSRHYRFPNAIDFGVTEPMGMNRALAPDEFAKLHELVELRGGTWPEWAKKAPEPWHHEMATRDEVYPPYPNARALAEAGPNAPSKPKPPAPKPPTLNGDDMVIVTVAGSGPLNGDIAVLDGLRSAVHTTSAKQAYQIGRSEGILKPGQDTDAKLRARLTELALNIDTGELSTRLKVIKQAGGYVDPFYNGKF